MNASTKYIFVTGGVLSSLGKGIASSSLATLLKQSGYDVNILKIDPYINIDSGTMSPLEHGEVFVTADGAETDLDIGHYERFLNTSLSKNNNFTTGQIYLSVIEKERKGHYLGKTIQVVPHIVDEIKSRIYALAKSYDFLVIELGGTVGDIEGLPFLEAIRQLKHELPNDQTLSIHVTLIPLLKAADELKTKPTQHSVQELRRIGISPQIIIARTEKPLSDDVKKKLALSCDVADDSVIEAIDARSIYECPLYFLQEGILTPIARHFHCLISPNMSAWDMLVKKIISPAHEVTIAFVGKYLHLKESYKSLTEALIHAGANIDTRVRIQWLDSEDITQIENQASQVDGMLIPGGFGARGVLGKIQAIHIARTKNIPFLGICLGMQLSIIEFARNVLQLEKADSTEFAPNTPYPFIYLIEDFIDQYGCNQVRTQQSPMGATMRLGEYDCHIKPNSLLARAYNHASIIKERHRHRYEANPAYRAMLERHGLCISGESSNGLIEAVELAEHPFFLSVQFHPEFTSRLQEPNPLILSFIKHALENKRQQLSASRL